jgi:hypothetical protein
MASGAGKTEATIYVDDQPIQVPKPPNKRDCVGKGSVQ